MLTVAPVVVRTLVPLLSGTGHFTGALSGGNGAGAALASTDAYFVDVPSGRPALRVDLMFRGNPRQQIDGFLIAPSGTALDQATNLQPGAASPRSGQRGLQLTAVHPQPGRWEVVFGLAGAISGTATHIPYTGTVSTTPAPVVATGLPVSAGTRLRPGQVVHATVHIINTSGAVRAFILDPRPASQSLPLTGPASVTLRHGQSDQPVIVVPPETQQLTTTVTAPAAVGVELAPNSIVPGQGTTDPDVFATADGTTATGTAAAPKLANGQ